MVLQDRDGDLFVNIAMEDNVYPVKLSVILPRAGLAAWTTEGSTVDPSFKTEVAPARNGVSGMVIKDQPQKIPGLDACAACAAAKSAHHPQNDERTNTWGKCISIS
jgi:hypothetical protein